MTPSAVGARGLGTIEQSREALIGAIGETTDVSLVLCGGLVSDQLALAGARAVLGGLPYRQLRLEDLARERGELALLLGPALTRADHDAMPRAIAIAQLRFARVIVLPTSVDASEDLVRDLLSRTRATVFASDPDSYLAMAELCDAQLAHDCSFFFDFAPYTRPGEGVLSEDISVSAPDLDTWLGQIAAHDLVRTDRAQVMIAAALMGKRVEYTTDANPRLESIATHALVNRRVSRVDVQQAPRLESPARSTQRPAAPSGQTRVTAVLLTRDRPDFLLRALRSVEQSDAPARALVIDNNSAPEAARALADACQGRRDTELKRSDRNLGCAGGRDFAAQLADTELVLFLDDDAELMPGALDHLVAELERHPALVAVTATVLRPDETVFHSGGSMTVTDETVTFELLGDTLPWAEAELPSSGPSGWVPGTAFLVRRSLLDEFSIDATMAAYFEDNEWCYRVARARPDAFWRSREALVVHHTQPKHPPASDFESRAQMVRLLASYARFYEKHGLLLCPWLFEHLPELRADDRSLDLAAARLLMELVIAKGSDWTLMSWMNGDLDGLLNANRRLVRARALDVEAGLMRSALEQRQAEVAELSYRLRRVEESVTWQLFQRVRLRTLRLLGGEPSRVVGLLQQLLRRLGRTE